MFPPLVTSLFRERLQSLISSKKTQEIHLTFGQYLRINCELQPPIPFLVNASNMFLIVAPEMKNLMIYWDLTWIGYSYYKCWGVIVIVSSTAISSANLVIRGLSLPLLNFVHCVQCTLYIIQYTRSWQWSQGLCNNFNNPIVELPVPPPPPGGRGGGVYYVPLPLCQL